MFKIKDLSYTRVSTYKLHTQLIQSLCNDLQHLHDKVYTELIIIKYDSYK